MTLIMCIIMIRFIANKVSKYCQCITAPPCLEYINYASIQTVLPAKSTQHSYLRMNFISYQRCGGVTNLTRLSLSKSQCVFTPTDAHGPENNQGSVLVFSSSVLWFNPSQQLNPTQMLTHPCSGSPKSKR